jgi:hypothetical protein
VCPQPTSEPGPGPGPDTSAIAALENVKNKILAVLESAHGLEDSTKSMWQGDAKEMFYRTLVVMGLLVRDPLAARGLLVAAESAFGQVASELRALGETAQPLLTELEQAFSKCRDHFAACGVNRDDELPPVVPPPRVVKKSEEHYEAPCSVCGRIAVAVKPSDSPVLKGVICAGITRAVQLKPENLGRIYAWMAAGKFSAFHEYLKNEDHVEGGIDGYCPQCDKTYCRSHYHVKEFWDEGFYDCARGTCPAGHERKIDD